MTKARSQKPITGGRNGDGGKLRRGVIFVLPQTNKSLSPRGAVSSGAFPDDVAPGRSLGFLWADDSTKRSAQRALRLAARNVQKLPKASQPTPPGEEEGSGTIQPVKPSQAVWRKKKIVYFFLGRRLPIAARANLCQAVPTTPPPPRGLARLGRDGLTGADQPKSIPLGRKTNQKQTKNKPKQTKKA